MALEVIERMIEQRARDWNEAKAIVELAASEQRAKTPEEQARYDKLVADVDAATETIEREQREAAANAQRDALMNQVRTESRVLPGGDKVVKRAVVPTSTEEYEDAFRSWMVGGHGALTAEQRAALAPGRASTKPNDLNLEQRAALTVTTTGGGYVIPQGFMAMLISEQKRYGAVENVAYTFDTPDGATLELPTVADTATSGRLLAINTALTDTAITFGHITFVSYLYTSDVILVPWQLAQDWGAEPLEGWMARIAGERVGRITNTHFTTGDGSSKPSGIVTGASSAVTAAGTTSVTYSELLQLLHSIDPAYRENAGVLNAAGRPAGAMWMFNDTTLRKLREMTDDVGRPLWQAGLSATEPSTLLGYPYQVNQDVAAMTTGLKPIYFGNMNYYGVRRVTGGNVLVRLEERYADALQTGYFFYRRTDGRMIDPGADPVKYITMA